MTPSEDLFSLIKSLSPNEKGYFKKFSKLHVREGKNNYMRLFEAIDTQEEYDEEAIISKFKKEPFVKQFPVAKNYLFNLILKALDVYHSEVDLEIGFLIHCSLMLTDKAMFDAAHKYLKKAKTLAKQYHKLSYINKIDNHELYLLRLNVPVKHEEFAEELYKERVENAQQMQYVIELQHINDQMMILLSKSFTSKRQQVLQQMDKIMSAPEMKLNPNTLNIQALVEYWLAKMNYYTAKADYKNLYLSTQSLVKEVELNKGLMSKRTHLIALQNHCKSCLYLKKLDEAKQITEKLKKSESLNELDSFSIFQCVTLSELHINLLTGEFEKSFQLITQSELEMKKFRKIIPIAFKSEFAQLAAINYFAHGAYKEATKWLNEVLNSKLSEIDEAIVAACKILELVICIETNKIDLFEYKYRSYERLLKKEKESSAFDLMLVNGLKKIVAQQGKNAHDHYVSLLTSYNESVNDGPALLHHLKNFDIALWLKSKIDNVPFAQLIAVN